MRLIAVCEPDGTIVTLITMPQGGLRPSIPNLLSRQREVEVDAPDIKEDMDGQEIHRRLIELGKLFTVDFSKTEFVPRNAR